MFISADCHIMVLIEMFAEFGEADQEKLTGSNAA